MSSGAIEAGARLRSEFRRAEARRRLPAEMLRLPPEARALLAPGPVELLWAEHEVLVAVSGTTDGSGGPAAMRRVVRIASAPSGRQSILDHARGARKVHDDPRCRVLANVIPLPTAVDPDGWWSIEPFLGGEAGRAVRGEAAARSSAEAAMGFLGELHRRTLSPIRVDAAWCARWLDGPATLVGQTLGSGSAAGLEHIRARLGTRLEGASRSVCRVHGDPSPDNFLYEGDGTVLTAVLDWEATTIHMPGVDNALYLLGRRRLTRAGELGDDVVEVARAGWTDEESRLLGLAVEGGDEVDPSTLVTLAWLHHVAGNLHKSRRYGNSRWWVHHNVDRVVRALA